MLVMDGLLIRVEIKAVNATNGTYWIPQSNQVIQSNFVENTFLQRHVKDESLLCLIRLSEKVFRHNRCILKLSYSCLPAPPWTISLRCELVSLA